MFWTVLGLAGFGYSLYNGLLYYSKGDLIHTSFYMTLALLSFMTLVDVVIQQNKERD